MMTAILSEVSTRKPTNCGTKVADAAPDSSTIAGKHNANPLIDYLNACVTNVCTTWQGVRTTAEMKGG